MVKRKEIVKRDDGEMDGEEGRETRRGEMKTNRMSPMEKEKKGKKRRREGGLVQW